LPYRVATICTGQICSASDFIALIGISFL
jgi:hypothetical protein